MMKKLILCMALAAFAAPTFAVQTVAQGGGGDHLTIADAVAAAAPGEEVQIIDGPATYTESLTFAGDVIVTGTNDGVVIVGNHTVSANLTVNNLTFEAAGGTGDIFNGTTNGTTFNLNDCTLRNTDGAAFNTNRLVNTNATNCTFEDIGGNCLWWRGSATGAVHQIIDCTFTNIGTPSTTNNAIQINRGMTVTVDGCSFDGIVNVAIITDFASQTVAPVVTVTNCTFNDVGGAAVRSLPVDQNETWTITGNTFTNMADGVIQMRTKSNGTYASATIEENVILDAGSDAIELVEITGDNRVVNNLIVSRGDGINLLNAIAPSTLLIAHNTVDVTTDALTLDGDAGTTVVVKNNILIAGDDGALAENPTLTATVVDYNLINAGDSTLDGDLTGVAGANNLFDVEPNFRDAPNGDYLFDLLVGSPAIDAGDPSVGVATSLNGRARPLPAMTDPDIGAYEDTILVPVTLSDFTVE